VTFKMDALKAWVSKNDHAHPAKFSAALQAEKDLVITIYGSLGESFWGDGITVTQVSEALKTPSSGVTVRINSPGGDMFEGISIYNLLKASGRPVNVIVDGLAASAASVVAMAGDKISMGQGAMLMIHAAHMMTYGNSADLREAAAILEKASGNMVDIYAARSGMSRDEILTHMYAETWLTTEEAIASGFADEVLTDATTGGNVESIAAAYDLAVFSKTPDRLLTKELTQSPKTPLADLALRELELYGGNKRV
jgi:ATP-dependent Clp protease, protease subunit